jgi:hypothetical protein
MDNHNAYDFSTRLTAKIRRLGHPRRQRGVARPFLVLPMVLISVEIEVHIVPVNTVREG